MVKIYGMPGKTSAVINIPFNSGKGNLNIEFTRGCIDRSNYRPATYRSNNEIEQTIIESYTEFGKSIVLLNIIEDKTKKASAEEAPAQPVEVKEYPEVTSFEEAIAVLKTIPGVKAVQLRSAESAKKLALLKGISFPNYNFE